MLIENFFSWMLSFLVILSALGVILLHKPIHACLSFLVSLLLLANFYLQLSAPFLAVMQIMVYAGAILVIFVFVIVLFQDAYSQIEKYKAKSSLFLLGVAGVLFTCITLLISNLLVEKEKASGKILENFGTAQSLGKALYQDNFFPFEAIILLFLVAMVGSLYMGKKEV